MKRGAGTSDLRFENTKGGKKLYWRQKVDFIQQTVCGAPVCWSKYTMREKDKKTKPE